MNFNVKSFTESSISLQLYSYMCKVKAKIPQLEFEVILLIVLDPSIEPSLTKLEE